MKKLLLFLILVMAVSAVAQSTHDTISASGGTVTVANPGINGVGVVSGTFDEAPVGGSPASASITVQGCMRSTTCDTAADTNTATSEAFRPVNFSKVYDYFLVTATWSGGSTTSYIINTKLGNTPSSGTGSNVAVTSPVDGSGYVNIDCKTGCSAGNPNGQATMANSAPVAIASNQTAVPVSGTVTTTPPANASTNVAQVAGTTADTNSGVKSAGTLRVVLATDQPALTNKLLVTPDSVALPANQSVNEAQIGGVAPTMGNGASGTGVQRVTVASDSTGVLGVTQSGTWNVRGQDGAGNAVTTNSSTFTAKFAWDTNLLGTLGTAFSTPGKVDVKGADGDVFVRQTTGTNLHAVLDTTSTTAVTQATGTNLHAVLDTTSTTAVTQATGTNLHAVLDTTSTTAVTQATGTNLHAVTDATSTTAAQMTGTVAGTAPANTEITGCIFNSSRPAPTNGQTLPCQVDLAGNTFTTFAPTSASGIGLTSFANASVTTSVSVKASAGNIYGFYAVNGAATVCYLQFVNSSGTGTLGTAPLFSVPIPGSATNGGIYIMPPASVSLSTASTGIAVGLSTTQNGATACGTAGTIGVWYK